MGVGLELDVRAELKNSRKFRLVNRLNLITCHSESEKEVGRSIRGPLDLVLRGSPDLALRGSPDLERGSKGVTRSRTWV